MPLPGLTYPSRARLLETPFPAAWAAVLERNVRAYPLLTPAEQQLLRDLVQVFIDEKHWEGCGGLELDDEIRVTIAGSACLMILGREHDLLREVESILVYPSAVMLPAQARGTFDGRPVVARGPPPGSGAAQGGGPGGRRGDPVLQGSRNTRDGRNLVLHEIAHKIDFLDGDADGTPPLETSAARAAWARVCHEAFVAHQDGRADLLRDYATTNEAEFFAVATEVFFEKPKAMAREAPALYALLREFYRLDLAAR